MEKNRLPCLINNLIISHQSFHLKPQSLLICIKIVTKNIYDKNESVKRNHSWCIVQFCQSPSHPGYSGDPLRLLAIMCRYQLLPWVKYSFMRNFMSVKIILYFCRIEYSSFCHISTSLYCSSPTFSFSAASYLSFTFIYDSCLLLISINLFFIFSRYEVRGQPELIIDCLFHLIQNEKKTMLKKSKH